MQFIEATQDIRFQNRVHGEGSLVRGKTYYTFGDFARDTASRGLARMLKKTTKEIVHFRPPHLGIEGPRKILFFFSGGSGDAVTAGIVLPPAAGKHGLEMDICCAREKWEHIFEPMGMKGKHVPYPPDLETLSSYEAVLTDLTKFYPTRDGLKGSPVAQLIRGFHLNENIPEPRYQTPAEARKRWALESSGRSRIGVNFDSQGLVKSYPEHLQKGLVDAFLDVGLEVFLLGSRNGNHDQFRSCEACDLRGQTTIPELAAVLEQMDLVLGVDSFIVHLSNVLSRPTLALLSTTSPASFSWHRHVTCLSSRLDCSPCFGVFDECPRGSAGCRAFEHESMAPPLILEAVLGMMASRAETQGRRE